MLDARNIFSLTDFLRNHKEHLKRLKETRKPEVLTVNGKAEVVLLDAESYQEMVAQDREMVSDMTDQKSETESPALSVFSRNEPLKIPNVVEDANGVSYDDLLESYHHLLDVRFTTGFSSSEREEFMRIEQLLNAADSQSFIEKEMDARSRERHRKRMILMDEIARRLEEFDQI